jgi:hypothetical protein
VTNSPETIRAGARQRGILPLWRGKWEQHDWNSAIDGANEARMPGHTDFINTSFAWQQFHELGRCWPSLPLFRHVPWRVISK